MKNKIKRKLVRLSALDKPWFDEFQDSADPKDAARVRRWLKLVRLYGEAVRPITYRIRRGWV
jgi:hypothetical protein